MDKRDEVPVEILNALLEIALRTETGIALVAGFRIGRGIPDGAARLIVDAPGRVVREEKPA
jgi:hypothetical protein